MPVPLLSRYPDIIRNDKNGYQCSCVREAVLCPDLVLRICAVRSGIAGLLTCLGAANA